jgi:hypothetical protein
MNKHASWPIVALIAVQLAVLAGLLALVLRFFGVI